MARPTSTSRSSSTTSGSLRTTRPQIETALSVHADTPLSDHLEIETYTWDVLPAHLKTGDITDYVTRELEWMRDTLVGIVHGGPGPEISGIPGSGP